MFSRGMWYIDWVSSMTISVLLAQSRVKTFHESASVSGAFSLVLTSSITSSLPVIHDHKHHQPIRSKPLCRIVMSLIPASQYRSPGRFLFSSTASRRVFFPRSHICEYSTEICPFLQINALYSTPILLTESLNSLRNVYPCYLRPCGI
jgi:hypothetical protein